MSDLEMPLTIRHYAQSDPAALSPGREFPRFMFHATKPPVMISSAREERDLGPEWSRVYIHQEYPKVKYHWDGKTITVKSADQEAALGAGWANRPTEFEPYKDARRIRAERHDPGKWLDEWSVPGLTLEHRRKIKAQLLRADSAFERSLDSDPDGGALFSMRQAFDGIASVLFEAGILTDDVLSKDLPQLIWDAAIAGGWWRPASETHQGIFPERLGHYWIWRDKSRDWNGLFRAEAVGWEAELLEVPHREPPRAVSPDHSEAQQITPCAEPADQDNLRSPPARVPPEDASSELPNKTGVFASGAQRIDAVAAYTKSWKCSAAALARTARVDPADLSKWKKGSLPEGSDKKARIEKALKNNEAPTLPVKSRQ